MKTHTTHPRWILGTLGLSVLALTTCFATSVRAEETGVLGYVYTQPQTPAPLPHAAPVPISDGYYESAPAPVASDMAYNNTRDESHATYPNPYHNPYDYSASTTIRRMDEGFASYITGGIGDDEKEALDSVSKDYNLRIISAKKDGSFTGDTALMIENAKTGDAVNVVAGPIFLAELPPGKYRIKAQTEGQMMERTVTVSSKQQSRLHLAW